MRELLLSFVAPETLSWIGFVVLAGGLLGDVAILLIPEKHLWHKLLGLLFAAIVLVGYLLGHMGDDEIAARLNTRATVAENKLDKLTSDRSLTDAQLRKIADKLAWYAGQTYQITTFWNLREPLAIADRVYKALQLAHWKQDGPSKGMLLGGLEGIQVWIHPDADPQAKDAASALIAALNAEHLDAMQKLQNAQNAKTNIISLSVGTKPQ